MKFHQLFFNLILLFFFANCKKKPETDDKVCQEERKNILCAHRWKPVSRIVNAIENIEDCEKDDTVIFTADWRYIYLEGPDKCYMNAEDTTDNLLFGFNNCKSLVVGGYIAGINELNNDILKINITDIGVKGELIYVRIK